MTSVSNVRVAASSSRNNSDTKETTECQRTRHEHKHLQIEAGIKTAENSDIMFPWIAEFRATCRSSLARPGPTTLVTLLRIFNRNVSSDAHDCYKKPSRATKLKEHVKEALLLFMYFHRFEQQKEQNRSTYLELMSDLLAMYVDLELVVSKREVEPSKIAARLVSCLCIYLENSAEHLLDTLLKLQMSNELHCQVLDAIISKILKLIPKHPEGELMYVRYLLVYRLWRRIHGTVSVKKQINANAMSALRSAPKTLPQKLLDEVLPSYNNGSGSHHQQQQKSSSSGGETQSTKFYLCQQFDLRKACSQFVRYCKRSTDVVADIQASCSSSSSKEDETTTPSVSINERDPRLKSTSYLTSKHASNNSVNNQNSKISNDSSTTNVDNIPFSKLDIDSDVKSLNSSSISNNNNNNNNVEKDNSLNTTSSSKKASKLKSDDIVMIDLTDEEVTKIVTLKKRPKISWLETAKRNYNSKIKEVAATLKKRNSSLPLKTTTTQQLEDISSGNTEDECSNARLLNSSPTTPVVVPEKTATSPPVITSSKLDSYDSDDQDKSTQFRPTTTVIIDSTKVARTNLDVPNDIPTQQQQLADDSSSTSYKAIKPQQQVVVNSTSRSNSCSVIASTAAAARREEENKVEVNSNIKTDCERVRDTETSMVDDVAQVNDYQATTAAATNEYYGIHDQGIDGLTLLASVSAQQQFTTPNKRPELKVKPYSSLQQQPARPATRDETEINQVDIYPEDQTCVDKVAMQVEVSSSEYANKHQYQHEAIQQQESYDDTNVQSNVESNDNQNVIYNGETVMLLQKSPNSNLYIINKAAVDNVKVNYNSDEEDAKPSTEALEDTKPVLKHEPEDPLMARRIKADPDYVVDVKNGAEIAHYAGYCAGYPVIHHQSTDCACVSCVYCRPQLPYYIPAPVQANITVQEKMLYDEKIIYNVEKKESFSRFNNQAESKLPLKKRLKAQYANHQDTMDYHQKPAIMSMANVTGSNEPALELGAVVEVTSVTVKAKRGRKEKASNSKSNNQNVPNCFPRKSNTTASSKKKRPADDEVENMSAAKKPKKTTKGNKQQQQTRSSRRAVPQVNYVYPELDADTCNPSATKQRKKKRGGQR